MITVEAVDRSRSPAGKLRISQGPNTLEPDTQEQEELGISAPGDRVNLPCLCLCSVWALAVGITHVSTTLRAGLS